MMEEEEELQKDLSLDPQRNHHHNHHSHHQQQYNHNQDRDVGGGGGGGGGEGRDNYHLHQRHLHLHELVAKQHPQQPPSQQQDSFHAQLFLQQNQQTHELNQLKHHFFSQSQLRSNPLLLNTSTITGATAAPDTQTQTLSPPIKKRSYNPPSTTEHAGKMVGSQGSSSSRMVLRNTSIGEILEVQGGHIVRSTGRKDRHSKVCTAKGPRDRRVRLAAHTAIQFYDVQDRLGYDRPSKAVDWLIKKAKAAIDQLDELPPWKPTPTVLNKSKTQGDRDEVAEAEEEGGGAGGVFVGDNADSGSSLLPPSLDSDAIADTIKSFFPMGGAASEVVVATSVASSSPLGVQSMQFQNYPSADLLSRSGRGSSQSQDLKLSLQSLQDPMLIQSRHHHSHHQNQEEEPSRLYPGAAQIEFDNPSAAWAENQQADVGRFQRLIGWNLARGNSDGGGGGGGGFTFIPPQASQQPLLFGHGIGNNGVGHTAAHFFSQRGPLQSSNTPLFRAWVGDNSIASASNQDYHQAMSVHPISLSGIGYTSSGAFSGFHVPARIQGDEEEHDGNSNKPSSASSGSRH